MKKICVIGSLNIDMTAKAKSLPQKGETIFTDTFGLFIGGGKGANQAAAAAKLGADVRMAGILGDRFFGAEYIDTLQRYGVLCDTVALEKGEYPGVAYVAVDERGDNMLFVYSGANMHVTPEYIDRWWDTLSGCDIFLFQLEIPKAANLHAMRRLRELGGKTIILDPAPAVDFTDEYFKYADIVTPNEVELEMLTQVAAKENGGYKKACGRLIEKGAAAVIAKAGRDGAYIATKDAFEHAPAFDVKAVDTTAAGDSFNAGLAFGLSLGKSLADSVAIANAAGGLSTTAAGAQSAMPSFSVLSEFLKSHGIDILEGSV